MTPTLKQRLTVSLLAAGFRAYEDTVPHKDTEGTFEIITGPAGAEVRAVWWDRGEWERRELLERIGVALEAAGFAVEDRNQALYVAAKELKSAAREKAALSRATCSGPTRATSTGST